MPTVTAAPTTLTKVSNRLQLSLEKLKPSKFLIVNVQKTFTAKLWNYLRAMNQSINCGQLIVWSFLDFTVCKKTEIKNNLCSLIETISTLWNGFIIALFSLIVRVLCIVGSSGLSTKKLIKLVNKPPNFIINSEEEMGPLNIGYARVSSREQAENTQALEQQIARLKDAGAKQILSDVEKDKKDDRPQFLELMRLVEAGRVRTLIITRIDRITRSLPTLRKLVDSIRTDGEGLGVCNLRKL